MILDFAFYFGEFDLPAKDKFHDAVKQALKKAGWEITPDLLT